MKSGLNNGFWKDDVRKYFSYRFPDEFKAAKKAATEDGTIESFTWSQLLGKSAPPGYDSNGRKIDN